MLTFQVTEVENGFAVIILPTSEGYATTSKTFVFTSKTALFDYLFDLVREAVKDEAIAAVMARQ